MLLFLDVISPIPEFCVIDDNKVILQKKIIKNETDRLSDNIIQSYIEIDKRLNLTKNLKKISTTIGPGSYTSLRVGSAFISGLMISRKIPYYPLSVEDILNFNSKISSKNNLGVFITSSNNQEFLCYKNKDYENLLNEVTDAKKLIKKYIPELNDDDELFFVEFILWGLESYNKLSILRTNNGIEYKDPFNNFINKI